MIIGDLQGPKIRLGDVGEKGMELKKGREATLPIAYPFLKRDLHIGHRLLIDDGLFELKVTKVFQNRVEARVIAGGVVTSRKGINFPDSKLSLPILSLKDKKDAALAVRHGVDALALSFVRSAKDIRHLKTFLSNVRPAPKYLPLIIAKIEKPEALSSFQEILGEASAVMIARGDLGIEIPAEQVPIRQKEIISACRAVGKPVIVATQMLDSMIRNPRPTRAEMSDVENAVMDHADALMLSGESATGKFPLASVVTMQKAIAAAEASPYDDVKVVTGTPLPFVELLRLVKAKKIKAIIVSSAFFNGEPFVRQFRPEVPIFLAVRSEADRRRESLRWGIEPFVLRSGSKQHFSLRAIETLLKQKRLRSEQPVAILPPI
jgi:pyruvate kinase